MTTIARCMTMTLALALAGLAQAQGQPAGAQPAPAAARDEAAQGRPLPAAVPQASTHSDTDARECLDYVSNRGVILCAEKFRASRASRRR